MTRALLLIVCVALGAARVAAQTPVTSTQSIAWDHDGVGVESFRVCVDGTACTDLAGATVRLAPMPAMTPGTHTLQVQACNVAGCSAPATLAVRLVVVPAPPTQLRIVEALP